LDLRPGEDCLSCPVAPDPVGQQQNDSGQQHQVEAMKVGAGDLPVLAQNEAGIGQEDASDQGAEEGIEGEEHDVDPGHPGGQGDEGADHRQEAGEEDGKNVIAGEPDLG